MIFGTDKEKEVKGYKPLLPYEVCMPFGHTFLRWKEYGPAYDLKDQVSLTWDKTRVRAAEAQGAKRPDPYPSENIVGFVLVLLASLGLCLLLVFQERYQYALLLVIALHGYSSVFFYVKAVKVKTRHDKTVYEQETSKLKVYLRLVSLTSDLADIAARALPDSTSKEEERAPTSPRTPAANTGGNEK